MKPKVHLFSILIASVLIAACSPSPEKVAQQTAAAETAEVLTWTATPQATATPQPTPTPISLQSAIEQRLFSKLKVLKTVVESDRKYQVIMGISPDESWLITENGAWNLDKGTFTPRTFNTQITYGKTWTRIALLNNGDIALLTTDPESSVGPHPSAVAISGKVVIQTLNGKDLSKASTREIDFELEDSIEEMALSPDGSMLAVGLHNGTLYIWDVITGQPITSFKAHSTISASGFKLAFRQILFTRDGTALAAGGMKDVIKVWRMDDFSEIASVQGTHPTFSPDGKYLVCVYDDARILVTPLFEDSEPFFLPGHDKRTLALEFSNDSQLLVTTGWDNIRIWSIADKSLVDELKESDGVVSLALNPENSRIYVSYHEGGIGVWGLK